MRVPPLNLQGNGGGGGGSGGMDRLPLPLSFSPDMLWRYPVPFSPAAVPSSPAAYDFKTQMPNQLRKCACSVHSVLPDNFCFTILPL